MVNLEELLKEAREVNMKIDAFLEEQAAEENMDLEKTKLPDMDKVFGEGPVTDYVRAHVDYLQAEDSGSAADALGRMTAAAVQIEEEQKPKNIYIDGTIAMSDQGKTISREDQKGPDEPKQKVQSLDDFAEEISEAIGVIKGYGGKYREDFNKGLIDAVHIIEERNGKVKFIVQTESGNETGHISLSGDKVTIEVKGKTFTYDFHAAEEAEKVEPASELKTAYAEEGPLPCGCASVKDCKYAQEVEPVEIETPEQFVAVLSESIQEATAASMEIIENYLLGVTDLTRGQLDLVRHYLKQLPENSSNSIDELSDHAVELAWKRINYLK